MNKYTLRIFILLFSILLYRSDLYAQTQTDGPGQEKMDNYREQVKRLVGFFEFSLNTIGDSETPTREKETIINESFLKAFRDNEVMIEDDLDEHREMVTHKSIQAYLKDVDFFFREVRFDYKVQEVLPQFTEDGNLYFKVTANRNLQGITIEGDSINNDMLRYIELNLDENDEILKIVSIYTTKLNLKEELLGWWNDLPREWKKVLGADKNVFDSITLFQIDSFEDSLLVMLRDTTKIIQIDTFLVYGMDTLFIQENETIASFVADTIPINTDLVYRSVEQVIKTTSLDISENLNIRSLKPLIKLDDLENLDISNTLIDDIFPLRNLIRLQSLNCSGTAVTLLDPLLYSTEMRKLNCSKTAISSIRSLENMRMLESLDISDTRINSLQPVKKLKHLRDIRFENTLVQDMEPLADLTELELLDCSGSPVNSLETLRYLTKIKRLYIENTVIDDLKPLENLSLLKMLYADGSRISSLEGLDNLESLEKVYCDQTLIESSVAQGFMARNQGTLIIYESETLAKWWQDIPGTWKGIFSKYVVFRIPPTKEQLHEITLITEIDISGYSEITTLEPLTKLSSLRALDFSNTGITDLTPLSDLIDLKHISGTKTEIVDLTPLSDLRNLEILELSDTRITTLDPISGLTNLVLTDFDNTGIGNLDPLANSKSIKTIYCDGTEVDAVAVNNLIGVVPEVLVIYQTPRLKAWWGSLNDAWKEVFSQIIDMEDPPTREDLQKTTNLQELSISGNTSLGSADPLTYLPYLMTLDLSGTQISDLQSIASNKLLRNLNCSNNPITDITALSSLNELTTLDISNTAIDRLDPLSALIKLQYLKCSGTAIKNLDPLAGLRLLKELDFYNTGIKKMDVLTGLPNLQVVKCYNTKLSTKRVESFRNSMPGCEVIYY